MLAAAAEARAAGSSSPAADLQAAGQPSGAAAADLRAAGPSSPADERAADSSQVAPAAAERGNVNPGLGDFRCMSPKWGQRYHSDVQCRGLRSARSFTMCPRCPTCGPVQSKPVVVLFGLGPGHALHTDQDHIQGGHPNDKIREYSACTLCMF